MARAKSLFHSANHAINYCARSIAKVRVFLVKPAEIAERARVYLDQHPELYRQAFERARRMGWLGQEPLVTPMDWLTERKS
jgi:hypothetical protein